MFKKRIFWMILIGCGVVFLTVHHFSQKKTDPLPEKETIEVTATPVPSETEEPEQEEDVKEIVFVDEGMDEVMSSPEEEKLQDEILTLIKKSGVQGIDSATYLKDQTVELNEDDTCLYFRLSDGSTLPVCYRKSSDKFYLGYTEVPKKGEEKNLLSDDAYLRNEGGSK